MFTFKTLACSMLNSACIAAKALESVARHCSWKVVRGMIETTLIAADVVDPHHPVMLAIQTALDLTNRYRLWLGIGCSILSLMISLGEKRKISELFVKSKT